MWAKALLAFGLAVALVVGCSDKAAELGAKWGCGPIDGLRQFKGDAPSFILVGEFTETNEAPAAFAELACHLAASQGEAEGPLFVGVSEYFGGATEAEIRMRARLDALVSEGAPIIVGAIGGDDHPYSVHRRTAAEKEWARNIENKAIAAGASHSLLLMSRADAIAEPIPPVGERFSGYDPMATFLPKGEALALEIRNAPQAGVSAPTIRLYPKMNGGFHGQIALGSLTRPEMKLVEYEPIQDSPVPAINTSDPRIEAVLNSPTPRDQKIDALEGLLDTYSAAPESGAERSARLQLLRRMAASMIDLREKRQQQSQPVLPPAEGEDSSKPKDGIY